MAVFLLPLGISVHPSVIAPEYLLARLADPERPRKSITKAIRIFELTESYIPEVIAELVEWRDELGARLWPSWPDISRERGGLIPNMPKGVSCYVATYRRKLVRGNYSLDKFIRVEAYWPDYSKPLLNTGNYPIKRKGWRLHIDSDEQAIRDKCDFAKAHRDEQLDKYPKPENKFRWPILAAKNI